MSFDGGFCAAVTHELNKYQGCKSEKAYMPEKDILIVDLYVPQGEIRHLSLYISISPRSPLIMLTEKNAEKPSVPSPFAMLIRKHIASAKFIKAEQIGLDRIIKLFFVKQNELGYQENSILVIEMMGKYSNIFLLDETGKILGSVYTSDITASKRLTIPGIIYEPPLQDKINPLCVSKTLFTELAFQYIGKQADKFLLEKFSGVSPLIAREITFRSTKITDALISKDNIDKLWYYFNTFTEALKNFTFVPTIVENNGKPVEYSFIELLQYGSFKRNSFDNINLLQKYIFDISGSRDKLDTKKQELLKALSARAGKQEKLLAFQKEELQNCTEKAKLKLFGDLIIGNIYMLNKSEKVVLLYDYESEKEIAVEMDTNLSPQANAQKYYKKYKKLCNAEEILLTRINGTETELLYIDTIFDALSRAQGERELEDIREEMQKSGIISKRKKNVVIQKGKKNEPMSFISPNGYEIKVGKNNFQNEALTFSAEKNDLWFHAKNIPGAHVILYANGEEPSAEDYTAAAEIAAFYSKAKGSPSTAVDYTYKKFIKKPSASPPGFVTYDKYFTAYVSPVEEKINSFASKKILTEQLKMKKQIILGGRTVEYELLYKKVKNLNFRIDANGNIVISMPEHINPNFAEEFLKSNEKMILEKLDGIVRHYFCFPEKIYDGNKFNFLGREITAVISKSYKNTVRLENNKLYITVNNSGNAVLPQRLFSEWLDNQCILIFTKISKKIYNNIFYRYIPRFPEIKLRKMKACWANCRPTLNIITFNRNLAAAPEAFIEYIAAHEFSHFLHPNHSKNFYDFLETVMPDWKERENMIKNK